MHWTCSNCDHQLEVDEHVATVTCPRCQHVEHLAATAPHVPVQPAPTTGDAPPRHATAFRDQPPAPAPASAPPVHARPSVATIPGGLEAAHDALDHEALDHEAFDEEEVYAEPGGWLRTSIASIVSFSVHCGMVLLFAFITCNYRSAHNTGMGEEVFIGELPGETLDESPLEHLDTSAPEADQHENLEFEEVDPVTESLQVAPADDALSLVDLVQPSGSGATIGSFDAISSAGGGGGGDWQNMISGLRRRGLDIVICFDSTGSMSGEINAVKSHIERIGTTLVRMIPKARIGICTYRDQGDNYVVKGLPLTGNISEVTRYLSSVTAGGGGNRPEAVHSGLQWCLDNNRFRGSARKVILLFGDAPPHAQFKETCNQLARRFHESGQMEGVVSTISCRRGTPLPEFVDIAQAGGGEAFLSSDERKIMEQIIVLVFGSKYRDKVREAFRLSES